MFSDGPSADAPLRTALNGRTFEFARDTLAFANELVWEYRFDAETGRVSTLTRSPPPTYAHRCFVMVRSVRQFFYHAGFAPELPGVDEAQYRRLVRQVLARSPRQPGAERERVVIPGYGSLGDFSRANEGLLKDACGSAWQSYVLRSHWRMVFPITRRHQERTARDLCAALRARPAPIVHLVRFPALTINHGLLLMAAERTRTGLRFSAYDPNVPSRPAELDYEAESRTFSLPRNHYWPGGRVDVIAVFRSWFC